MYAIRHFGLVASLMFELCSLHCTSSLSILAVETAVLSKYLPLYKALLP